MREVYGLLWAVLLAMMMVSTPLVAEEPSPPGDERVSSQPGTPASPPGEEQVTSQPETPTPATETKKNDAAPKAELKAIVVTPTGKIQDEETRKVPAVVETITPEGLERINVTETSDAFKYLPGAYLRKLSPGSTNQPLVIRGISTVQTGRVLVLTDGQLISDFTATGNSNAPRWQMVIPEEIEGIDVIYGPFSAALSGNSMAGSALITTRMPEKPEAAADITYSYRDCRKSILNAKVKKSFKK